MGHTAIEYGNSFKFVLGYQDSTVRTMKKTLKIFTNISMIGLTTLMTAISPLSANTLATGKRAMEYAAPVIAGKSFDKFASDC